MSVKRSEVKLKVFSVDFYCYATAFKRLSRLSGELPKLFNLNWSLIGV